MINIGLCADEGYAMGCGVCITSIFESNPGNDFCIHILTNGFTEDTTRRFKRTAEKYNQTIKIYDITTEQFSGMPIGFHFSIMIYARLLFASILDNEIEKIIYLDCDIVVVADLSDLWNTEFEDCSLLAVPAVNADEIQRHNRIETYNHAYINSGVLVMNLNKWRSEDIAMKCIKYIDRYPERCIMPDQDALNAVLCDDMGLLHFKYNFTVPVFYNEINKMSLHKKRWSILEEARKKPVIIHYTSSVKPWHKEFKHSSKEHFITTHRNSLWSDYKIDRKYHKIKDRMKYAIVSNLMSLKKRFSEKLKV